MHRNSFTYFHGGALILNLDESQELDPRMRAFLATR
jgi:hypothetical protein